MPAPLRRGPTAPVLAVLAGLFSLLVAVACTGSATPPAPGQGSAPGGATPLATPFIALTQAPLPPVNLPPSALAPIPDGPDSLVGCGPFLEAWIAAGTRVGTALEQAGEVQSSLFDPAATVTPAQAGELVRRLDTITRDHRAGLDQWRAMQPPPAYRLRHDYETLGLERQGEVLAVFREIALALERGDTAAANAAREQVRTLAAVDINFRRAYQERGIDLRLRPCPEPYDGPPITN